MFALENDLQNIDSRISSVRQYFAMFPIPPVSQCRGQCRRSNISPLIPAHPIKEGCWKRILVVCLCVWFVGFHRLQYGWKVDPCVRSLPVPFPFRWRTHHCGECQLHWRYWDKVEVVENDNIYLPCCISGKVSPCKSCSWKSMHLVLFLLQVPA